MTMLKLLFEFFKIGLFSFGGGYAAVSLIRDSVVENGWMTAGEFADVAALSQITPGPIAVNAATFAGYRTGGVPGALAATLGVAMPSFILVSAAMKFVKAFSGSESVKALFYGLRPAAAGMIAAATLTIAAGEVFPRGLSAPDPRAAVIFAAAAALSSAKKISPIVIIIAGAAAGAVFWGAG
jgi:chromate transporter